MCRRSEEHTSELQSHVNLVCRLLLDPPPPELYTLSLHDALPISDVQAAAVDASKSDSSGAAPDAYRIGPEDMLQISVWKNEPMSRAVPVRPDGKISLPLLNDVQEIGRAHV